MGGDEPQLGRTREAAQGRLAALCAPAVRLVFPIDQAHRAAATSVASASSGIVSGQSLFEINGPAAVQRAISALGDVDVGHCWNHKAVRPPRPKRE